MEKVIRAFFYVLAFIYGFNALYILFFCGKDESVRIFSIIETNKLIAVLVYLLYSTLIFIGLKYEYGLSQK